MKYILIPLFKIVVSVVAYLLMWFAKAFTFLTTFLWSFDTKWYNEFWNGELGQEWFLRNENETYGYKTAWDWIRNKPTKVN